MSIVGPQPGVLTPGALAVSGTGAALNDTPIPATDARSYRWVTLQITGTFVATITFEQSNDATNWVSAVLYNAGAGGAVLSPTTSGSGSVFEGPATAAFFRVRVSAYTSGTVAVAALFSGAAGGQAVVRADTELPTAVAWADAASGTATVPAVEALQTVFGGVSRERQRTPNVFIGLNALAVGAIATVWTPGAGKKFRLMGGVVALSAAGNLLFEDNAGGAFVFRVPGLLVNTTFQFTLGGNGFLSAAANNVLKATSSVAANLTGTLYGTEE